MRKRIALVMLLALSFFIPRASRVISDWATRGEACAGIGESPKPAATLLKGTPVRLQERVTAPVESQGGAPHERPTAIPAPATSTQLRLLAVESQPTYLKIRLLGAPKNHRSPPAA